MYLDPWSPVEKALITHGHSDHARFGHNHYLCVDGSANILKHRLGSDIKLETLPYGKPLNINGVAFSFHPAGHIPGSAQIRVEYQGEVWVFSGDYKLEHDGISEPFEPIRCHTFITESTFGLPVYKWQPQQTVFDDVNAWWRQNQADGKVSVLAGYTLGKAQRLLKHLDPAIGKIFVHGAIDSINQLFPQLGLPATAYVSSAHTKKDFEGAMIVCPPSALGSPWLRKFQPLSDGVASGWMSLRGTRRRRNVDRGFALSDHADWDELNTAVKETGAARVYVTHGYTDIFAQWLRSQGIEAHAVKTHYEGELNEIAEETATS